MRLHRLLKNSSFVSGHHFSDAVSSLNSAAPLGAGHKEMLGDQDYLRHGVKVSFSEGALAREAKANLHPLAFSNILLKK
jgi:hypothetical protein